MENNRYRIKYLTQALGHCKLEDEERWLVHQERAYLINTFDEQPVAKPYSIPEDIESKIETQLKPQLQ